MRQLSVLNMYPKLKAFKDFMCKKRTLYVAYGMLISFGLIFLILATPLNVYLPGYLDVSKRALVMESAMRIDSLELENDLRLAYLENMISILRDRVKTDSLHLYDSAVNRIQDTLLSASEREAQFVANYEEQERFGLNVLDVLMDGPVAPSFLAPVKGKVFPAVENRDGILEATRIQLDGPTQVLAPQEGTVVAVDFILGAGYKVSVQHANDYITIFSHLSSVMIKKGQQVKSGRVLGHAGDKSSEESWMELQVWHKGKPIEPTTLMPIE